MQQDEKDLLIEKMIIFFDEVMPQIGGLFIQDYGNLNDIGLLMTRFKNEKKMKKEK